VNLFVKFSAAFDVMRGKPAADSFVLQVSIETVRERLIGTRVTDEASEELNGGATQ